MKKHRVILKQYFLRNSGKTKWIIFYRTFKVMISSKYGIYFAVGSSKIAKRLTAQHTRAIDRRADTVVRNRSTSELQTEPHCLFFLL